MRTGSLLILSHPLSFIPSVSLFRLFFITDSLRPFSSFLFHPLSLLLYPFPFFPILTCTPTPPGVSLSALVPPDSSLVPDSPQPALAGSTQYVDEGERQFQAAALQRCVVRSGRTGDGTAPVVNSDSVAHKYTSTLPYANRRGDYEGQSECEETLRG